MCCSEATVTAGAVGISRQALTRQHAVIIVAIAVGELLVIGPRQAVILVVLGHAAAPVHGVGHFVGPGIKLDLLLEILLGLVRAVLPVGQPGALPVRVGGLGAVGKALVEFAVVIDGAIVILLRSKYMLPAVSSADSSHGDFGVVARMCSRMVLRPASSLALRAISAR